MIIILELEKAIKKNDNVKALELLAQYKTRLNNALYYIETQGFNDEEGLHYHQGMYDATFQALYMRDQKVTIH